MAVYSVSVSAQASSDHTSDATSVAKPNSKRLLQIINQKSNASDRPKGVLFVLLQVRVKPRSRRSVLVREPDGTWLARLKAPPVDGRANLELVALVAAHLKCSKAAVTIKSGTTGRIKMVKVEEQ